MEDTNARRIMQRHLVLTRRIRELDHRTDSSEFAEERLREFDDRIQELKRLRDQEPEDIATLNKLIAVSLRLLRLKRQQFNLPVIHGGSDSDEDDLEDGGAGVPSLVRSGPPVLAGCGGRTFAESDEINDW